MIHAKAIVMTGLAVLCGVLAAEGSAGEVTYYYTSPTGSVLATADAAGNMLSQTDEKPFGAVAMGAAEEGPGFAGHVSDLDSGMSYMQARYYDPSTGRFLSTDPVVPKAGAPMTINRYSYVNNNPVGNVDPFGLYTCTPGKDKDGCSQVEQGRLGAKHAAAGLPEGSPERTQMEQVVDFYGEPGVDNGVHVVLNGSGMANDPAVSGGALLGKDGKTVTIGLDLGKMAAFSGGRDTGDFMVRLTGKLVHEGWHGFEERNGWLPRSADSERAGEKRAYTLEANVYRGLGAASNPGGLWSASGGVQQSSVDRLAEKSTQIWCSSPGARGFSGC